MFPSTPHSPGVGPTLDVSQEWRRAAQRVARTYKEWCAADRDHRNHVYLSFLDALGCEERAARQLELDVGTLRITKGDRS